MKTSPLALPKWDIERVFIYNCLLGREIVIPFSYGQNEWEAHFSSVNQVAIESKNLLSWRDMRGTVSINETSEIYIDLTEPSSLAFFDNNLEALDHSGNWSEVDEMGRGALIAHMLRSTGAQSRGVSYNYNPDAEIQGERADSIALSFHIHKKGEDFALLSGVAAGPSSHWLTWLEHFSDELRLRNTWGQSNIEEREALSFLDGAATIQGREIMISDFVSLSEGDVLLAVSGFYPGRNEVSCQWSAGGYQWSASCSLNQVIIKDIMSMPTPFNEDPLRHMSGDAPSSSSNFAGQDIPGAPPEPLDNPETGGDDAAGASAADEATEIGVDLSKVTMPVSFVVGRKQVSLSELESLKSGHVFVLESPVEEAVEVLVNGVSYATGRLVDIDGLIGVQLTNMKGAQNA